MKRNLFTTRMLGGMLVSAAIALVSCSDDLQEGNIVGSGDNTPAKAKLTTATLAVAQSNQARVRAIEEAEEESAAEAVAPGTLRLIATIENPSKEEGFMEVEDRFLSATCVYYDAKTETFYTTYHMQGNNYNTTQEVATAGMIETFKLDTKGQPVLEKIYRSANPKELDFDFNHIYFDNTDQRIIVAGHNVKGGKQDNTNAIIATFSPTTGDLNYCNIVTNEKFYDENGKSLGNKDAGDANSVTRANDKIYIGAASGYLSYYVATRKGLAVLHADEENLFQPELNEDGTIYFIPTPGSTKFVVDNPGTGSRFDILYLIDDHSGEGESYTTSSKASIAHLQVQTAPFGAFGHLIDPYVMDENNSYHLTFDPQKTSILDYNSQTTLPAEISPIDGKNVLCSMQNMMGDECYAALGTGGMYYKNEKGEGVLNFGNRPVNCVYADENQDDEKITTDDGIFGHDGFIYVANGSKLTILHRLTLEEIVSWNMPSKDEEGNEIASSANYITVTKAPKGENGLCERTITVAFGQEGLRVFKFMPTTRVWKW